MMDLFFATFLAIPGALVLWLVFFWLVDSVTDFLIEFFQSFGGEDE